MKRAVPESLRAALAARKDGNPLAGYSVPLVVSYGGGINSAAMLVGMHALGVVPDAIVFSDTKGEKPETYESVRIVSAWAESAGLPPILSITRAQFGISKTGDESLEEECLRLGTLPSRGDT